MAGAYVRKFSSGLHGLCMHVALSFGWGVDDLILLGLLMRVVCILKLPRQRSCGGVYSWQGCNLFCVEDYWRVLVMVG